jgi:hypothetical protein
MRTVALSWHTVVQLQGAKANDWLSEINGQAQLTPGLRAGKGTQLLERMTAWQVTTVNRLENSWKRLCVK